MIKMQFGGNMNGKSGKLAVKSTTKFTDVAGHWAEKEIYEAAEYGWIRGYEDNTFKPGKTITRAEAAQTIYNMLTK